MAKKAYVGVGGSSRNVRQIFVGVNGEPRKVIKGYVGVNGAPCLFWDDSIPPIPPVPDSWDYWTTVKGKTLLNFNYEQQDVPVHAIIQKENTTISDGILFYGHFYLQNAYYREGYYSIAVSNYNKVYASNTVAVPTNHFIQSNYTYLGTTWGSYFINGMIQYGQGIPYPVKADEYETYLGEFTSAREATYALADRIIATPFHEDYQTGRTYNLTTTSIRKTIRKALSTVLLIALPSQSSYLSRPSYAAFNDNIDTIIDTLVNKTSGDEIIMLDIYSLYNNVSIDLYYGSGASGVNNVHVVNTVTENYRTHYVFEDGEGVSWITPSTQYRLEIDSEGNITETYLEPDQDIQYWAGMSMPIGTTNNTHVQMTNLGIDL